MREPDALYKDTCKPDVHFPFNEFPFFRVAQPANQILESLRVLRGVVKPRQEVERLIGTQVPAVMQPPRDGWQIIEPNSRVLGTLLENPPPLILWQFPPLRTLANGYQRSAIGFRPANRRLPGNQVFFLSARRVAGI